ncbi:hypothetical protein HBI56_065630 [Parastagonospora nodorum]|uniref:DSBA-like thioredoxin domain-containing protein n=2 Tax=Phaeosphaeria nodorum (strain SN15 / ATCC MYA-4574 / FGSC 10173) TaxID=321614 RepID=A0A7U2END3_PHANO|nr:hypothetical protein SNOG_09463 [Parastagonospora nodorum SN15]KAH3920134.1 hypothetical protein HBH56_000280 [Parastagonospora nodorum]EAT82728.1 hypothetical protein SNOG_09463 [Parastagonospora nodorum SN15]KAH3937827.1 hypothetical protein HBH54_000290 [Parastagonospora nodorum]KAH3958528.1 hypothetical protein HBH51_208120 [Parastagonospora nodorum]KAH4035859.1 hypothetical protein HBI09_092880 [Parastagonospora nodorum]
MSPPSPTLTFNFDISCPFAYIASTRVRALATRTNTTLTLRPVLLGAIYRSTAAPQGAAGSASDVFNSTKKRVTAASMGRTLRRYGVGFKQPAAHPMKSVNALRMLYCVRDDGDREKLMHGFFNGYWVSGRDMTDPSVLVSIAKECGIGGLDEACFANLAARKELESATAEAIERGAFGVPGFWIPEADGGKGRFFWGQDRMHFVEATLLSLKKGEKGWASVPGLQSLMPRCIPLLDSPTQLKHKTKLEFWFDFSSPWAFLGYTQLARLQRQFPGLEIELKPFLLGILFREIGAPNMPMLATSEAKREWSRQDHVDWTAWWNAVNAQGGTGAARIDFNWASVFPIRTPTVLRVGIVEPRSVPLLYSACWEKDENVSDEKVLADVLTKGGFDGADLIARANDLGVKAKLRELTAAAKEQGICGVPTYQVLRQDAGGNWKNVGGLVWGQDETNVVEDLIAGWDPESSNAIAEPRKGDKGTSRAEAKL